MALGVPLDDRWQCWVKIETVLPHQLEVGTGVCSPPPQVTHTHTIHLFERRSPLDHLHLLLNTCRTELPSRLHPRFKGRCRVRSEVSYLRFVPKKNIWGPSSVALNPGTYGSTTDVHIHLFQIPFISGKFGGEIGLPVRFGLPYSLEGLLLLPEHHLPCTCVHDTDGSSAGTDGDARRKEREREVCVCACRGVAPVDNHAHTKYPSKGKIYSLGKVLGKAGVDYLRRSTRDPC